MEDKLKARNIIDISFPKGAQTYKFASSYLVGGVSSSIRVNQAIQAPLYISHGNGSRLFDVDGNEYIDFNTSYGAAILGHNHLRINKAVEKALGLGIICSHETIYNSKLAQMIVESVPCAELVRFAPSGTEA
ncbi:MAG: aminotransferase class III-fold pyridoxal phosphate-dependent enzyme, partial [Anaerolineaceae bacterium]|nr:aminotransferase class III-fold pyridoxal phosphate-dependent enzyme [Anaerolineaceae bacterium]